MAVTFLFFTAEGHAQQDQGTFCYDESKETSPKLHSSYKLMQESERQQFYSDLEYGDLIGKVFGAVRHRLWVGSKGEGLTLKGISIAIRDQKENAKDICKAGANDFDLLSNLDNLALNKEKITDALKKGRQSQVFLYRFWAFIRLVTFHRIDHNKEVVNTAEKELWSPKLTLCKVGDPVPDPGGSLECETLFLDLSYPTRVPTDGPLPAGIVYRMYWDRN